MSFTLVFARIAFYEVDEINIKVVKRLLVRKSDTAVRPPHEGNVLQHGFGDLARGIDALSVGVDDAFSERFGMVGGTSILPKRRFFFLLFLEKIEETI